MSTWIQDLRNKNPALTAAYAITGAQSHHALRNMIRALESLPALNTPDDDSRLAAARYIIEHDRK